MATHNLIKTCLLVFLSLILCNVTLAEEASCADIQCDCSSLPMDDWKNVCKARELVMMRRCESGQNLEELYCTAHGPSARLLPLALKLTEVEVLATNKLPSMYKRVAALYWAARKDLQALQQDIKNSRFEPARGKLSVLQHNIDILFATQRQITVSWIAYEAEAEAAKSWKDFASDTLDIATDLNEVAREIWNVSNTLDPATRSLAENIALVLVEESGKVFEQAAYAFAESGQHDNAARIWLKAAGTSAYLLEIYSTGRVTDAALQKLKLQRAARLYRASFHWVKEEREGEARDSLKEAQELFEGKDNIVSG